MNTSPVALRHALRAVMLCLLLAGQARAQTYDTFASEPNPRDFVKRAGSGLTLLGNPLRVAGMNLNWAALRADSAQPGGERAPTKYEVADGLATVQAMGGAVIRVLSAGVTAGCPACLVPAPGQVNPVALAAVDLLLKTARDDGIKVIIPLAGAGAGCDGAGPPDPVSGTPCIYARWHGQPAAAFFTDAGVQDDFRRSVLALLNHVNTLTGIAYRNDPTILAWENCDGCGAGIDSAALAAWTEQLGQAIKQADQHHLYENGAFAGRLGGGAGHVSAAQIALPSVDIVADRIGATAGPGSVGAASLGPDADGVTGAGRAYLIDAYGWTPRDWPVAGELETFLGDVAGNNAVSGALVTDLEAHADQGGYLPGAHWAGAPPPLYFPGIATAAASEAEMQLRARIIRRFSYRIIAFPVPPFAQPDGSEILDAKRGQLRWRGAAGARTYNVERSGDPRQAGSWKLICHRCLNDANPSWQDSSIPGGKVWHRITPLDANFHAGNPSDPEPAQ